MLVLRQEIISTPGAQFFRDIIKVKRLKEKYPYLKDLVTFFRRYCSGACGRIGRDRTNGWFTHARRRLAAAEHYHIDIWGICISKQWILVEVTGLECTIID